MRDGTIRGRVLIVAGSDSGGGAGIQADLKTVTALGAYGATAITALTAQNTETVAEICPVPAAFVARQMSVVLDDLGADCIKTGMMHSTPVIEAVADIIDDLARDITLVVDPVMVSTAGGRLLQQEAMQAFKARLVLRASLITPNIPEAEALTGLTIDDVETMVHAAEMLHTLGAPAALVTGGHLAGDIVCDVLKTDSGIEIFEDRRIETRHNHGAGCTLASGIAAGLAQGMAMIEAIARARAYLRAALRTAPGFGRGNGPVNHCVSVAPFKA